MALQKEIELSSGIVVNYHRVEHYILSLNNNVWVEVKSYISANKRQEELALEAKNQSIQTLNEDNVMEFWEGYTFSTCYEFPYKENMTIQEIYDELKKQPMFEGATDC